MYLLHGITQANNEIHFLKLKFMPLGSENKTICSQRRYIIVQNFN